MNKWLGSVSELPYVVNQFSEHKTMGTQIAQIRTVADAVDVDYMTGGPGHFSHAVNFQLLSSFSSAPHERMNERVSPQS